jgi:ribokinase
MAEPRPALPAWVVGSLNIDLVTTVQRHPQPGETVTGTDPLLRPGGKGANQALAAARAGAHVSLVGRVGTDAHGLAYRDELHRRGINVHHLTPTPGVATGQALICVTPAGENTIVVTPGANARLSTADIDALPEPGPAILLLQLEVPVTVSSHAARRFAAAGSRIIVNPSPVARLGPDLLALADPLIVNHPEASQLAGHTTGEPAQLAHRLLALGARSVVITLGAAGAYLADATGSWQLPAPAVTPVDTTGAGDAFAGTLAAGLARRQPLPAAASAAICAATAATGWHGAQDWTFNPTPTVRSSMTA